MDNFSAQIRSERKNLCRSLLQNKKLPSATDAGSYISHELNCCDENAMESIFE